MLNFKINKIIDENFSLDEWISSYYRTQNNFGENKWEIPNNETCIVSGYEENIISNEISYHPLRCDIREHTGFKITDIKVNDAILSNEKCFRLLFDNFIDNITNLKTNERVIINNKPLLDRLGKDICYSKYDYIWFKKPLGLNIKDYFILDKHFKLLKGDVYIKWIDSCEQISDTYGEFMKQIPIDEDEYKVENGLIVEIFKPKILMDFDSYEIEDYMENLPLKSYNNGKVFIYEFAELFSISYIKVDNTRCEIKKIRIDDRLIEEGDMYMTTFLNYLSMEGIKGLTYQIQHIKDIAIFPSLYHSIEFMSENKYQIQI